MRALPLKMPAEKPLSRASESRRSNKPLMEKRRRARINESLSELKTLILDAMKKDSSRHSKLEKADILEMTVKHLQNLQRQQMAASITSDPTVINKFRAGFGECASEVTRFLDRTEGLDASVRSRLLGHLSTCLNGLDSRPSSPDSSPRSSPAPTSTTPAVASTTTVGVVTALSLAGDVNNNGAQCNLATTVTPVLSGLQLIPTRLASGDIAFILPSSTLAAAQVLAPPISPVTTTASTTTTTEPPDSTADGYERNEPHSSEESSCASLTPPPASPAKDMDDNDEDSRLVIKEESVWRPW